MASVMTLKLKFGTMSGTKTWSYKYAEPNTQASDVKLLMDAMISNGAIFKYPPLTKDSAEMVETKTTTFDLN